MWVGGDAMQKASRLKSSLHFIGLPAQNKHTLFVEDGAAARQFDAAKHFDTDPSLLSRTFNRPRTAQLEEEGAVCGSRGMDGGASGEKAALKVGVCYYGARQTWDPKRARERANPHWKVLPTFSLFSHV